MRKICVFIGSNSASNNKYVENITVLAEKFKEKEFQLVYGGAQVGLMGKLANTLLNLEGRVIGVIPKMLATQEIAHEHLTELYIVESIQERKAMMATLSDAFIALPGGLGTLEEIFEIWNAIKLGLYQKPFGFLNVDGYFNSLFDFLKNAVKNNFITQEQLNLVTIHEDPAALIDDIAIRMS